MIAYPERVAGSDRREIKGDASPSPYRVGNMPIEPMIFVLKDDPGMRSSMGLCEWPSMMPVSVWGM